MRTVRFYCYEELSQEAKIYADSDIKSYAAEFDWDEDEEQELRETCDFYENGELYKHEY